MHLAGTRCILDSGGNDQEIIRKQPYNYKTDVWSSFGFH